MDADMRDLLEAIRDVMTFPPGEKRDDATDCVYAVLHVLLGDDPPAVASQTRWLREEMAAVLIGGGPGVLARRTIAALAFPVESHETCQGNGCEECALCGDRSRRCPAGPAGQRWLRYARYARARGR